MAVNLNLSAKIFSQKFLPYIRDYSHRWEVYMGSAGSGKSYFIAQKLIIRAFTSPIKILVCRRYGTTLRNSCFELFKEILAKWQLTPYVKIYEGDMRIHFNNGSNIIMLGLDDEGKLLSIQNISTIWVEEAFEVEKSKIEQLDLRMRGVCPNQQLILSFNPISKAHWLYDFCELNPPESFVFLHSTYKDNKFLKPEYIATLEELRIRNPQKARVFCDGEWGINTDTLIYHNWRIEDFNVLELAAAGLKPRHGVDLGFVDPTAIISTLYDADNKTIYIYQEFAGSGLQLDEIYAQLQKLGIKSFYYDSAEPRAGDYFKRQYLDAKPSIKGKDSVPAGIMFLQNHTIVISPTCTKTIEAFENYCFEVDKRTDEITDVPEHTYSHLPDALRYAYCDIYTKQKLRTLDKSVLGL